jgi:hypothetical protein
MNRREAIQRAALVMGGAVSMQAILAVLESCAAKAGPDSQPSVLSGEALAVVTRVADIMVPRTDTPGALDVGVPAFIDTMLKETFAPEARGRYLEGLREFDGAAREANHKAFVELAAQQQRALVEHFLEAAIAESRAAGHKEQEELATAVRGPAPLAERPELPAAPRRPSFILTTRELTLLGFFTSRPGATQVLQYLAIPGAYHGCLPVSEAGNGRRWAT